MSAPDFDFYFKRYVDLVPEGPIVAVMDESLLKTVGFLNTISEDQANSRYEEGKWLLKEVVGHMIDTERVFAYRALRFARNDSTDLPGYDENQFAENSNAANRNFQDLIMEFANARRSTIDLYRSFDDEIMSQGGTANGLEINVGKLGRLIVGHAMHHRNIITERYL